MRASARRTKCCWSGRKSNGLWIGRSSEEAPEGDGCITLFTEQPHRAGEFVRARITGADAYDLTGEIL